MSHDKSWIQSQKDKDSASLVITGCF